MCGVTGGFHYRERHPFDRDLLARMTRSIAHRGPDDEGLYADDSEGIGLGVRRLSIIDLAGGHQPMCNEDGRIWLVFNGEIYNFQDLRRELASHGHAFATASDTETIIHAYEQWGLEGLARLNGMFGLAIWDQRLHTLVLARDPFGVKPLYYRDDGATLLFGSELRTILCSPDVTPAVDREALDQYVSLGYVPSPRTVFSGIKKLLPGHALVCSPSGVKTVRFSRPAPEPLSRWSERDVVERLSELVSASVKRQMVSDVPIGAMLSGGVDSSTVAAIMTEASGGPIETFTVGFEDDFKWNELEYAREASRRIGSNHHEVRVSSATYADFLPLSIEYLEEPVATGSTLAYYSVCALARESVKVVLTGQGADEPFAGYSRHMGERYGPYYRAIPSLLRTHLITPLAERLPRNEKLKRAVRSLGTMDPLERLIKVYGVIDARLKDRIFRDGLRPSDDRAMRECIGSWYREAGPCDALNRMLYVDARTSLADNLLLYGDKMSMAVSLEARVPFLDLELMEFVESIPQKLKIRGLTQKYALKKAVSPRWVPPEVIGREKIGFRTPLDEWFHGDLKDSLRERLNAADSACRTYFNIATVNEMLDSHAALQEDNKRILFALLTFELWHDAFIRGHRVGASSRPVGAAVR